MKALFSAIAIFLIFTCFSFAQQGYTDYKGPASASEFIWALPGAVQSDSVGNDTTPVDGTRYWVEITIPYPTMIHGISYLIGSVGGTDSVYAELYNTTGELLETSTKAIVGTAQNIQNCVFATPYDAWPGRYFISLQFNGTTARFMTHSVTGTKFIAGSATGTFGDEDDITPGTTYTAAKGPFCAVY